MFALDKADFGRYCVLNTAAGVQLHSSRVTLMQEHITVHTYPSTEVKVTISNRE